MTHHHDTGHGDRPADEPTTEQEIDDEALGSVPIWFEVSDNSVGNVGDVVALGCSFPHPFHAVVVVTEYGWHTWVDDLHEVHELFPHPTTVWYPSIEEQLAVYDGPESDTAGSDVDDLPFEVTD